MQTLKFLLFYLLLHVTQEIQATNYYFMGFTNNQYSEPTNWASSLYPGTILNSGDFARFTSNYSQGNCFLDVDIINNGHILLDSYFFYDGYTITNNGLLETTGTIWGDVTNEVNGILSPGWDDLGFAKNATINGNLSTNGTVAMDFNGTNFGGGLNEHDSYTVVEGSLAGTLLIRFNTNFIPLLNSPYTVINASTNLTGAFSNVIFPTGVAGFVSYTASHDVQITFTSVLPIELTQFSGKVYNKKIDLTWEVASELNNSGFEVQKSENGNDWRIINFVEGRGTTNEVKIFQYQDENPFSGVNYYRLKQIDFDGAFAYSEVIAIEYISLEKNINVFPNPSNGFVNLKIDNPSNQRIKIKVSDNLGRIIWKTELIESESYWRKEIEFNRNGIYFVAAQIGDEIYCERVIITYER